MTLARTIRNDASPPPDPTRLNLGSGDFPVDGFTNVDLYPPADVVGDICDLDFHDVVEVRMSHSLEHVAWLKVPDLLARIYSWLVDGGLLWIEVPDMEVIMAEGDSNELWWLPYIYGSQTPHDGETHRSGFTPKYLAKLLWDAGFREIEMRQFRSEHPYRPGMPCIEVTAVA